MPSVMIHYDGWVLLPEWLRKALGVRVGDRLEAELVDGGLMLRAARPKNPTARPSFRAGRW